MTDKRFPVLISTDSKQFSCVLICLFITMEGKSILETRNSILFPFPVIIPISITFVCLPSHVVSNLLTLLDTSSDL